MAQAVAGNKKPPMFDMPSLGNLITGTGADGKSKPFSFNVFTLQNGMDPTTASKTSTTNESSNSATPIVPANAPVGSPPQPPAAAAAATRDSILERFNKKIPVNPPRKLTEVENLVVEMVDTEERYVTALRQLRSIVDELTEIPTLLQFGDQKSISRYCDYMWNSI